jgi:hypothetical protein
MRIHWAFHSCSERLRTRAQDYWARKSERLEQVMRPFHAELRHLTLVVDRQVHPLGYKVRAVLTVPTRTIVVEDHARFLRPTLDRVLDLLSQEVKQQLGRLRQGRHAIRTVPEEVEAQTFEE